MEVQAASPNSSCGSNNVEASFRKTVYDSEVLNRRLYLQKNDVETIITPHLTSKQVDILRKAEGAVEVVAIDVKTGDRFKVNLRSAGYGYFLTGISAMIKKTILQANHEIDVSWCHGALHVYRCY